MTFDESLQKGIHRKLAKLAGEWQGFTKTWFDPTSAPDESEISGKISAILGRRFLLHEYTSSLAGKPFEGLAIFGFDLSTEKFQSAWVDSFHMSTGIMFSEGGQGDHFAATGSYFAGAEQPRWGWRTEIDILDDNNLILTAINISPEGVEAKATETRYSRKA